MNIRLRPTRAAATTAILLTSGLALATAAPASSAPAAQRSTAAAVALAADLGMVSAVPSTATPEVADGAVHALAEVGNSVVIGGTFSGVDGVTRNHLAAFNSATGDLSSVVFDVNGPVYAVATGVLPGTAFIGGDFTTVGGVAARDLSLVDLATGKPVSGWTPPALEQGYVEDLEVAGSRLYIAGTFRKASRLARAGLATASTSTGALDSYASVQFEGHHNDSGTGAQGRTGLREIEISPDGTRLVAIGNFKTANGQTRDQIAMLNLGSSSATVSQTWATSAYADYCNKKASDSYIRGVDFSTDGSFIVVAAKGGGQHPDSLCDAAARFEVNLSSSDVQPTWQVETGGDTVWAVTITGNAVFVGGHNKWINNPLGKGLAMPGAIARPGLMALDPASGRPLTWNPGRNPRGVTVYQILHTSRGIYVASDTAYIGNRDYYRPRIAFFPNGGVPLASTVASRLPGTAYIVRAAPSGSPAPVDAVTLGSGGKSQGGVTASGLTLPATARGAFVVGGTLFYGDLARGKMVKRSVSGATLGAEVVLDPYHDPYWKNIANGSGGTYDGADPTINAQWASVTSASYAGGRVLYTLAGSSILYSRWFAPDSGAMDETVRTLPAGAMSPSTVTGMFVSGNRVYYSNTSGQLLRLTFSGASVSGTPVVIGGPTVDGINYSGRALYLVG